MKQNLSIAVIFIISFCINVSGQEKKNHSTLSGDLAHFTNFEIDDLPSRTGYFKFALSPGVELIYSRKTIGKFYC